MWLKVLIHEVLLLVMNNLCQDIISDLCRVHDFTDLTFRIFAICSYVHKDTKKHMSMLVVNQIHYKHWDLVGKFQWIFFLRSSLKWHAEKSVKYYQISTQYRVCDIGKYRREKSMSMKTKKLNVLTAYLKLFLKSL